jgi:alpha-beta hydrolase superfamily lysophospholipase
MKAYVGTPHAHIRYRRVSTASSSESSKPVLIFLHKSASSSIFMKTLIYHCTALDYDIYAQDMPGFGGSFHPNKVIETFTKEQSTKRYCNLCAIM